MQRGDDPNRNKSRDRLLRRIEAAFGGVRLGGGRSLHQVDAMDDYEEDDVVAKARELDTEVRWQDVSDDKLVRFAGALPFLDAEGFRFYFPRFMTFALRHPDSDSAVPDTAIYWSDMDARPGDQRRLLTEEQKAVIRAFAAFHAD